MQGLLAASGVSVAMPVVGTPLPGIVQSHYGSVGGYRQNTGTWAGSGGSYYYPNSYPYYSDPLLTWALVGGVGFDGGGCGTHSASCGGGSCAGQKP